MHGLLDEIGDTKGLLRYVLLLETLGVWSGWFSLPPTAGFVLWNGGFLLLAVVTYVFASGEPYRRTIGIIFVSTYNDIREGFRSSRAITERRIVAWANVRRGGFVGFLLPWGPWWLSIPLTMLGFALAGDLLAPLWWKHRHWADKYT